MPALTSVVVTGAQGQVGREVVSRFSRLPRTKVVGLSHAECDVGDFHQVMQRIVPLGPRLIVHAAAWTDVDGCEKEPDRAFRDNTLAVRHVRLAAEEAEADLIHLSTDYVFDGASRSPYREWDAPNPLSIYGASKLGGEREALLWHRSFVVRTSWVIGTGRNFARTVRGMAERGETPRVVTDQLGRLTIAADLAEALATLWRSRRYGLWHITNGGEVTWHDVAIEVLRKAGLTASVIPTTSEELGRPAWRPLYSVLDGGLWAASGFAPLPHWTTSLHDHFDEVCGG
jgi:dTDP-4-dehydrorhamnose reductase